ncbi:MAG: hypothetical protein MK025_11160 [Acidobacteriia bacterium]|nr:hypothetical protein [Terriglobia bacterium]
MYNARIFQFIYLLSFIIFNHYALAQSSPIMIQGDIRVFTVMAALRTAGFDEGLLSIHPAGQEIAREFQKIPNPLKKKLKNFYETHRQKGSIEDQITSYISLALVLEGPPNFKPLISLGQLPPDAWTVTGFSNLLKEFYSSAKVEAVWSRYRHLYRRAIIAYRPVVNDLILKAEGYLRISSASYRGRQLIFIPEFLVPPKSFNARTYQSSYYFLFGPSEILTTKEIRHQLLHFLLDPYTAQYSFSIDTRKILNEMVKDLGEILGNSNQDLRVMVTESLIKAVEMRLDKTSDGATEGLLEKAIGSGALLTQHFYEGLKKFETKREGFSVYYRNFLDDLDTDEIRVVLENLDEKSALVSDTGSLLPTKLERTIKQAKISLGNNKLERAEELFKLVLERYDPNNGDALYGLGIISVNQSNKMLARDYFIKAIDSMSSPDSIKVWSHIYLGRLFDIENNRTEAIVHYLAAVQLKDDTRNAQTVAQQGLESPFSPNQPSP